MRKTVFATATCLTVVLLFSVFSFSFQTQAVKDFKIGFMIDKVFLKWKSEVENPIEKYEIERSFDNVSFNKIGDVETKGDYSDYVFIDKNIFKANARTFYYRIKVLGDNDTFTYSKTLQLTPRVSSAKQTWGSIKAIFH